MLRTSNDPDTSAMERLFHFMKFFHTLRSRTWHAAGVRKPRQPLQAQLESLSTKMITHSHLHQPPTRTKPKRITRPQTCVLAKGSSTSLRLARSRTSPHILYADCATPLSTVNTCQSCWASTATSFQKDGTDKVSVLPNSKGRGIVQRSLDGNCCFTQSRVSLVGFKRKL